MVEEGGKCCFFNDVLNTFYLRLYGVRHMVKDHSDSERGTRCRTFMTIRNNSNCLNIVNKERKEANVLFNDALNTFYLRLYGVRHMIKNHSDRERGNPLPPHGLLFSINSKGSLYAPSHRQNLTHTTAFVTPVVEHWLEREISQWVSSISETR